MPHGVSSKPKVAPRPSSLALVETFRDLSPAQLAQLEQRLLTVPISRGQVLMRQGDAADALYIVVSGRFAVDVDGRRVAEVRVGSPLGEIGAFNCRVVEGQRPSTSHFRLLS